MSLEPRSDRKQTRVNTEFLRGLHVGGTELNAETLAKIATITELDQEDLDALVDSAETLALVGDESGGLVKDVADLQEDVTALQMSAFLNYMEDTTPATTYTYDSTPTGDVTATMTANSTCAVIEPGGSTSHALTFALPAAPNLTSGSKVFRVDYDLGTHAGDVTIGDEVVTGAGVLHFFWSGTAWETWDTGAYTVTVPDNCSGILISLVDADDTNTLTVVLPTGAANVGKPLSLLVKSTASTGTAAVVNLTGNVVSQTSGLQEDVADVKNGDYLLHCIAAALYSCVGGVEVNA